MNMQINRKRNRGFTLVEIMVVVVILGILAATIIPQFIGTTKDAKVSAAKAHIAELESAIERYYVHMDRYPAAEEGLKILVEPPAGDGPEKVAARAGVAVSASAANSVASTPPMRIPIQTLTPNFVLKIAEV